MKDVEMDPDFEAHVLEAIDGTFRDELGPQMADNMRRYCPIWTRGTRYKEAVRTHIVDTIEDHVEDHTLIVSASGGNTHDEPFATDVEFGHQLVIFGYRTTRRIPPDPFMRKTLYQEYGPR